MIKTSRILRAVLPDRLLNIILPIYHIIFSVIGSFWYGNPSKKLVVIGVTGTNGKSTVVNLLAEVLAKSGIKAASISSLRFRVGDREWKNEMKMTMPGRFFIQKFLARAIKEGATHAIIEVTSEGIKQFRHKNINWDILVFTNLSPEHIESHGGYESYKKAKGKLFKIPHRVSIVNLDDEQAEYFLDFQAKEKIGYGIKNKRQDIKNIHAESVTLGDSKIKFYINGDIFEIPLVGEFNVYNSLAVIATADALGISIEDIQPAFKKIKKVSGRMEFIDEGQSFKVIVDYAHTPDSLEKVYKTIKDFDSPPSDGSKIICVLGSAGGGRDKWKRGKFGEIAARNCDKVIITNEDPYDEDPENILDEIEKGFIEEKNKLSKEIDFYRILNRRSAIKKAVELASPNDIVIITGKGSEPVIMGPNGTRAFWDDRCVAREEILKLQNKEKDICN